MAEDVRSEKLCNSFTHISIHQAIVLRVFVLGFFFFFFFFALTPLKNLRHFIIYAITIFDLTLFGWYYFHLFNFVNGNINFDSRLF